MSHVCNLCNNFLEEPEKEKPEKILMQLVKTISVVLNNSAHFFSTYDNSNYHTGTYQLTVRNHRLKSLTTKLNRTLLHSGLLIVQLVVARSEVQHYVT